ncbi:MAG: M3 family oligoendopeptidase [Fimbriimonadaceae bacterium]|nr:M3 family oligoendopeptidase [Fimbriimonadaceae bacterium]
MSATTAMPKWNLEPLFSGLPSDDYANAVDRFVRQLEEAERQFDHDEIDGGEAISGTDLTAKAARAVNAINELGDAFRPIRSFVYAHITTDATNEVAQKELSVLTKLSVRIGKLDTRFTAWLGRFDIDTVLSDPTNAAHEFPLRKRSKESQHMMSPAEEALAADLSETGGSAWGRLYGNFSSQIEVPLNGETLSMSAIRTKAYDSDAGVRESAYHAELEAWKANELPIAAAMNAIKGESRYLTERRGWPSVLDMILFENNMSRASLDAMMSAARKSFPVWRRYLKAKAHALGYGGGLKWCDIFAPVGAETAYEYDTAETFVEEQFRLYSAKMGDLAQRSAQERWVDAEPRKGKRDGAFCMGVLPGVSRILMNYKPAFGSVSTLAHELGHAYHNLCLRDRTPLQSETPMPLAETASIFCETIIKRKMLAEVEGDVKVAIFDATLQGECQVVVDITSRFLFEDEVFRCRGQSELSARELCEIMRDAQANTYGDGLNLDAMHPYMWAVKPHYYGYRGYYNFPYMFGLLFALGLYAIYQREPEGFHERYDDLLSSTGMYSATELAQRFGINIEDEAFWAGSLNVLAEDIEAFVEAVGADV